MYFLHTVAFPPIIHRRDLRSPNIFIASVNPDYDVVAKVGDFGLAQVAAPQVEEKLETTSYFFITK